MKSREDPHRLPPMVRSSEPPKTDLIVGGRRLFFFEHAEQPSQRIVILIDHPLFERNNRVVSDVNLFRTNLAAALGDVAIAYAALFPEVLQTVSAVERMHLKPRDADEETRAGEIRFLVMVAQHVADVLAQEAFNALAKLLHAIHVLLVHPPLGILARRERNNL